MAAGIILIREAGGVVSDIQTPGDPLLSGDVVCGNETIHGELTKLLRPLKK
jgi:myo-inositol-1(or 4)-monophosphatase